MINVIPLCLCASTLAQTWFLKVDHPSIFAINLSFKLLKTIIELKIEKVKPFHGLYFSKKVKIMSFGFVVIPLSKNENNESNIWQQPYWHRISPVNSGIITETTLNCPFFQKQNKHGQVKLRDLQLYLGKYF